MLEQIEKIETITNELQGVIDKEKEILTKLFVAAKGYLSGRWKMDYQSSWGDFDVKVKVEGFHLLGKVHIPDNRPSMYLKEKPVPHIVVLSLIKSTLVDIKTKKFKNEEIASTWALVRNYISLIQVVDVILAELGKKLDEAKKQNWKDISERVDQVC